MSCWLKGCLIVLLILGISLCLVAIGGYFLYRKAYDFTSASPLILPVEQVSSEQHQEIQQRIKTFAESLEKNQFDRLELTARDLNTLVTMTPGFEDLRGKVGVAIETNRVTVRASFPIKNIPGFSGRFVHAGVGLHLSLREGRLRFYPESMEIGGHSLVSSSIMKSFAEGFEKEFIDPINDYPGASKLFSKIQTLEILGDKLLLVPKPFSIETESPLPKLQNSEASPQP